MILTSPWYRKMPRILVREQVKNVGFISTRFKGTDGVSLETRKWVHVLQEMGFRCFYFAGQLDTPTKKSMMEPLADFQHPLIVEIYDQCFSRAARSPEITAKIHESKDKLKKALYNFIGTFDLHLLIVENALAIPLNIPLGLAITEVIAETRIKTIAHHHDFYWERKRFLINSIWDYVRMSFPPDLPTIQHVVINRAGSKQLALSTGISSTLIPNVMYFNEPPDKTDVFSQGLRKDLGLTSSDMFILQPTRVVQRKGIEHAIELADQLGRQAKVVISHGSGDEGHTYLRRITKYAETLDVDLILAADIVGSRRKMGKDGKKIYKLSDFYQSADLVTFCSIYEGFGNVFLEAIYYKKPVVVNNYSVYSTDIKPKGFQTIEIDEFITDETVAYTKKILSDKKLRDEIIEHNFDMARRYYSYRLLRNKLNVILDNAFGLE